MSDIFLAAGMIAAAVVALGMIYLRAAAMAKDQARHADLLAYMREKDRAAQEAEAQSKALQLYSLQATLDTIRAQAEVQGRAQEQTAYALRQSIEALRQDHRTVDALAAMQWKALETHFTAGLPDKKKTGDRYWERGGYYD